MPLRPNMETKDYLDIVRRRKWLALFSFLVVMFAASVYNVATPELYKSTTTILVVPQRVPENYVQSTVSFGIEDRLATIRQQVMSRTRLKAVMEDLGLFTMERKKGSPEDALEIMRKSIEIDVASDRGRRSPGTDAFSISFLHGDPRLAMLTASRLASLFIDENLKNREQQAVGTSEFLESQMREIKAKLETQEEKVKQYKMRYMGELPQELQTNLTVLTRLQDQFKSNADSLRAAGDRKVFLEAQLSMIERGVQTVVREDGTKEVVIASDSTQSLLAELTLRRSRLADLTAKYTERYPEVIQLQREVDQLERRIADARQPAPKGTGNNSRDAIVTAAPAKVTDTDFSEVRRIKAQIVATDAEIVSLKAEKGNIQRGIADLQSKVDKSPRREQEMISLSRDYENLKRSYDDLLKKKLDADISQNLEKRQKGEQFEVIDPANLPERPFKPDRRKIFGLAFLLALGLGFGGAIGLEAVDPTLRNAREFKHFFDTPILASIPVIQDAEYSKKKSFRRATIFGGIVSLTIVVSAFLALYAGKIRALLRF